MIQQSKPLLTAEITSYMNDIEKKLNAKYND